VRDAEVCALGFYFWIGTIEALILVACGLLMPKETKWLLRIIATWVCLRTVTLWHWSARWEWYAALFAGAAIVISFGEYVPGLGLLSLSSLALFSKLMHWHGIEQFPRWSIIAKIVGGIGITTGVILLVLIMLDIKGNNPWSHLPAVWAKYVDAYWPVASFTPTLATNPTVPTTTSLYRKTPIWVYQSLQTEIAMRKQRPKAPTIPPPQVELLIAVGDDDAEYLQFTYKAKDNWMDEERSCIRPFKCYPKRDLDSRPVEMDVGAKHWGRMFFAIYNTGGSTLVHPRIKINLANGHDISIDRKGQRHPANGNSNIVVEFFANETQDILPFSKSHSGYQYVADVTVGSILVDNFILGFTVFGDNFEARTILIKVKVVSS
jgi:hypothetical protein